jgi:hypothetical protein
VRPARGGWRGRSRRRGDAPRVGRRELLNSLAGWIERKIEAGELRNYAHAARVMGLSGRRLSQIIGRLGGH